MENFREIIIDSILSKKIDNFNDIQEQGIKKRNTCVYYDGNFCQIFFEEKIVSIWTTKGKIKPHPVLCYLCPYFSIRYNDSISKSSLLDIYLYYVKMKDSIEREIEYIESKMNNIMYAYSSIKRRKEELITLLNDINDKLKLTLELIKLSQQI
ncbi:hypothetical protein DFR86_02490 [Acidianus sulfidivorans JP7]|uniref:Uncharacterized protein n=1 Tax=Acidianus sulfidivorans JP7 TaxID=619593 RepID=A0A2U9IKK7_9CREN|nr:hypothetical protein [Acidianus sulfidivorans]AWR96526.1 hypothetical protein DFR86_02490 [Acidianus sulfidivorans JP7]